MKLRTILLVATIGLVAFTLLYKGFSEKPMQSPNSEAANNVLSNVSNGNIGIPQTYGPEIIFTGNVIPFSSVFNQPETQGWKSMVILDKTVNFHSKFFNCVTDTTASYWYLIITADCQNNQDAHSVQVENITEKVRNNDPSLKYIYTKDTEGPIEHQYQSDEIRGVMNGNAIWCYDDEQARYCEIKRSDGTILFVTGGYFHEAGQADQDTFASIVLGLVN